MLEYVAERLNCGVAIIRKNCLSARSETGGQRLAILYSFAATCKTNNICFRIEAKSLPTDGDDPNASVEEAGMKLVIPLRKNCKVQVVYIGKVESYEKKHPTQT